MSEDTPTVWALERALLEKHLEIRRITTPFPGGQYYLRNAGGGISEQLCLGTFTECANAAIAYAPPGIKP